MGYFPDATVNGFRQSGNVGLFLLVETDPALHLSFSINDIPMSIPNYDVPGIVYRGCGALLDMPSLEILLNGIADSVSFSINGLDQQLTALMMANAPSVLGARVVVALAAMDQDWQPIGTAIPVWTGSGDLVAQSIPVLNEPTKNKTQSLTLMTTTGDQSRQISNNLTYSDATQKALHPGDNFCVRTIIYKAQTNTVWPRF